MNQPEKFGKYVLLDRVSVGGMAEIFRAKIFGSNGEERIIAVKRMLPFLRDVPGSVDMFLDEAKISGQLQHDNIGRIHELGKVGDAYFIAMELIEGRDLFQLLRRLEQKKQRLSVESACFIQMKVCEGLDYAHRKRDSAGEEMMIVHRDCSPQNVLISFQGEVKVIDFGIAKAANRNARTSAGVLKGKFGYMSPEQIRGLPTDRRSDVFSIGIVLYESLVGRRLFYSKDEFAMMENVRNASVDIRKMESAGVPFQVQDIVCKALARNPEDRYQWCSALKDDLLAFLRGGTRLYTGELLGKEMRGQFAMERERERERMKLYARIGPDGELREEENGGFGAGSDAKTSVHRRSKTGGWLETAPTEIFVDFDSLDFELDPELSAPWSPDTEIDVNVFGSSDEQEKGSKEPAVESSGTFGIPEEDEKEIEVAEDFSVYRETPMTIRRHQDFIQRSQAKLDDSLAPSEGGFLEEQKKDQRRYWRLTRIPVLLILGWFTLSRVVLGADWIFIDGVNLLFHEAGHVIFRPGGNTLWFLGGSLLQILLPACAAIYFFVARNERFAAAACSWWVGENFLNVARYMHDAPVEELPLVGGNIHDWNYLFTKWGILRDAREIADATRHLGTFLMVLMLLYMVYRTLSPSEEELEQESNSY